MTRRVVHIFRTPEKKKLITLAHDAQFFPEKENQSALRKGAGRNRKDSTAKQLTKTKKGRSFGREGAHNTLPKEGNNTKTKATPEKKGAGF